MQACFYGIELDVTPKDFSKDWWWHSRSSTLSSLAPKDVSNKWHYHSNLAQYCWWMLFLGMNFFELAPGKRINLLSALLRSLKRLIDYWLEAHETCTCSFSHRFTSEIAPMPSLQPLAKIVQSRCIIEVPTVHTCAQNFFGIATFTVRLWTDSTEPTEENSQMEILNSMKPTMPITNRDMTVINYAN